MRGSSAVVIRGLAAAGAVAALLGGCSVASLQNRGADTAGLTDVTIQIDGTAVPYYAPLYAAVDQGFFAEQGLNVTFSYAEGATALQNVAAGNVEFGFPNGDSVVTARGKGVDIEVVHTTYQQGIGAVLFNAETSGISSPADLAGKTVAVTDLGSPNYIQLQAMLKAVGLTTQDINLVTVGSGSIVSALQNGDVDAIAFSRLRYYALQSAGFPVGQILSDEYLPSFGNVLVASPHYVEEHRDVVRRFVAAFNEGIQYSIGHPDQSVADAIRNHASSFSGQEASVTEVVKSLFIPSLWQSPETDQHGLGYGDLERWQSAIDDQAANGLIPESYPAADLVVEPDEF